MPGRPAHGSRRMAASPGEPSPRVATSCSHSLRAGRSTPTCKASWPTSRWASPMPESQWPSGRALRLWREVRDIRERLAMRTRRHRIPMGLAVAYSFLGKAVQPVQGVSPGAGLLAEAFPLVEKLLRINPSFLTTASPGRSAQRQRPCLQQDGPAGRHASLIRASLAHSGSPGSRLPRHASIFMPWPSSPQLRQRASADRPPRRGRPAGAQPRTVPAAHRIDAKALAYPISSSCLQPARILRLDARTGAGGHSFREAMEVCAQLHASQPQFSLRAAPGHLHANQGEPPARRSSLPRQGPLPAVSRHPREPRHQARGAHRRHSPAAEASRDLAAVEREAGKLTEALILFEQTATTAPGLQANALDLRAEASRAEAWDGTGLICSADRSTEAVRAHQQAIELQKIAVAKEPEQVLYRSG